MKWIGQHIYDLVARFRNDFYLEDLSTTTETNVLVVDSTGKVSKTTVITGDVTGVTAGSNITVTNPTGPVPTVALSTNVDVAGTLDVTSLATFDAEVTIADNVGIGTVTPNKLLHVNQTSVGNPVYVKFQNQGGTGSDSGIILSTSASLISDVVGSIILADRTDTGGAGSTDLVFQTSLVATMTERMRILASGNIGIGTATPAQKLDVVGKISLKDAGDSIFVGYEAGLNDDASANLNVGVGYQALRANTTGASNSAVGYRALYSNTTGAHNTATGVLALEKNTTGAYNTAHGALALSSNTTGTSNSAVGVQALYLNTTGSYNTATGVLALEKNTTGANNSAVGYQALYLNTTGANNSAVGFHALRANTTGASNTATGMGALYSNTTGANNSAVGYQALYLNTTGINNVAVGRDALFYNTVGNQTAVGFQALYYNTIGVNNTAHGYRALHNNTTVVATLGTITGGSSYTDGTYTSVLMTYVSGSTAVTYPTATIVVSGGVVTTVTLTSFGVGFKDTTTVLSAAAASIGGTGSGFTVPVATISSGDSNTAIGLHALYSNTTGDNNSATGVHALYLNTTGQSNTADGPYALHNNTTGVNNAALGYAALYENTTGSSNTAIGRDAGRFIADGITANTVTSNSVFLGNNTKALAISQTNQIVIGDTAVGLGSNTAILGNSSITKTQLQGNIGLGGQTNPASAIDYLGNFNINGTNQINLKCNNQNVFNGLTTQTMISSVGTTIPIIFTLNQGITEVVRIAGTTGNVGIGTAAPLNKLDIVGSLGRGAPVTKTTNFTVAATENWLIMNGTATITITLPTASSFTGRELMIKNIAAYTVISASSNVKPIDTDTAATAILPATAGSWCTLVSDGTNWVTMMN